MADAHLHGYQRREAQVMRRWKSPLLRLAIEMRAAACQIDQPRAREIAAREASAIPLLFGERFASGRTASKGDIAKRGRAIMKSLPLLAQQDDLHDAAAALSILAELLLDSGIGEIVESASASKAPKVRA